MPRYRARSRGFTLFELLVVVAILATLTALAVEVYAHEAQSTAVNASAEMISDALTEARTSAVAQNMSVEVRFYAAMPQAGGTAVYSAMQLRWLKPDGTTPPVTSVLLLPDAAVIDATVMHSPLIGANTQSATPDASDPRLDSATRVFHFLPDGSTDLNPATNWFLTVRAAAQSDPAHFPANWACVGVNATTGRTVVYRP